MIDEGCKKWELTLCGYFVGHKMSINELRYNLRRMWGRKGFKDVINVNNGVYYMKFYNEKGLDEVVNSGPWMVSNKPFFVQKWNIYVCLDKGKSQKYITYLQNIFILHNVLFLLSICLIKFVFFIITHI